MTKRKKEITMTKRKPEWPEQVPILDASDICKNDYNGPNNTRCLDEWMRITFPICRVRMRVQERLRAKILSKSGGLLMHLEHYNDIYPKKESAKLWNEVMAELGYVVPCERKKTM